MLMFFCASRSGNGDGVGFVANRSVLQRHHRTRHVVPVRFDQIDFHRNSMDQLRQRVEHGALS